MATRTAAFRRLVRDHMSAAPMCVTEDTGCGALIERLSANKASSALVVDAGGRLRGIVTEQDVVRRMAFRLEAGAPVTEAMSAPVITVAETDPLYRAIGFMRRQNLRHMPVVDANGQAIGLLQSDAALAAAAEGTVELIERLTHEDSVDGLTKIKAAQVEVAERLFAEAVPAPEIQALLSDINSDIHGRILRLALARMADDGWGAPPVNYCLIIMGSGGRGENFLYPDQDNGFVLADYPDAEHNRVDAFFIELAERMTAALDSVGLPLCRGFVMASNPVWRKSISQWKAQMRGWVAKQNSTVLRLADIFFDFQPAYGDLALGHELRAYVGALAAKNPSFLRQMYGLEADHKVALGFFGRLLTERDAEEHQDEINLKYKGTLPLVEAVRLFALRHAIAANSTLGRIEALHTAGVFDADQQDYLSGAFHHITLLLLRQQIADYRAGREVDNFVPEAALSQREKDYLVDCFGAIRALRGRVRDEMTGEIF